MKNLMIFVTIFVTFTLINGCCETGSHKCDGGDVYVCSESGEWEFDEYCSNGCSDGYCNGPCADFQHECGKNTSYYCWDEVWWESAKCENGCDESTGKCNGLSYNDCTHGQYGCDNDVEYWCVDGHWYSESCPAGCDAYTGQCSTGWYFKCIDGDSYYCSMESCDIVDVCHQYGCNASTGQCNTNLPNGSDEEGQGSSSEISECGSSSSMPCKDSSTGLMWSEKAYYYMSWKTAVDYCDELNKSGYSDWRMPNIDELRTLIKNCPESEPGGECPISESDGVLSQLYVTSCMGCGYGSFDKLNDADILWSASTVEEDQNYAWFVSFSGAEISVAYKYEDDCEELYNGCVITVRCVR